MSTVARTPRARRRTGLIRISPTYQPPGPGTTCYVWPIEACERPRFVATPKCWRDKTKSARGGSMSDLVKSNNWCPVREGNTLLRAGAAALAITGTNGLTNAYGMAYGSLDLGRVSDADAAGDRARDRQHRLHLHPVEQTARRGARSGAAGRARAGDGDADPAAAGARMDHPSDTATLFGAGSGDQRSRPHPDRRRAVPGREEHVRDPRQAGG